MEDTEFRRGPGRPPKAETLPVKILRAYWPLDGRGKCEVGDEIDLSRKEALDIIGKGVAIRNDPL